jgi:hypothetical protein
MNYVPVDPEDCFICGHTYLNYNTIGLCPKDEKIHKDGYIALVGIISAGKSDKVNIQADRTGKIAHLDRKLAAELFELVDTEANIPILYVEDDLLDQLHFLITDVINEKKIQYLLN